MKGSMQADIVIFKNLTLLVLSLAVLQCCHPFEGPSTAVFCCIEIDGGFGVFGGAKLC